MFKKILLILTVFAAFGSAIQLNAQTCNGPMSVTVAGSSTGLPLTFTSAAVTTPITCYGGTATVTIVVGGGSPAYTYTFNGTSNTTGIFSGVSAGIDLPYSVTDVNNCGPITGTITVTQPAELSATVASTNVTCNGANDGTITITSPTGGSGTYEYSINGGTEWQPSGSFTGLVNATYNVQIRDAANPSCVITLNAALEITQPAAVVINSAFVTSSYNGAQVSCVVGQGTSNDGQITVVASGGTAPLEYSKDNGANYQATGLFNGLTAGTYTMVVKDANGCTASAAVTITAPPAIAAGTCDATQDICQLSAGQIKVAASGGTGVLNVTWTSTPSGTPGTPSGSNQAIPNTPGVGGFIIYSDLKGGVTYNFVVTDANGCKVP